MAAFRDYTMCLGWHFVKEEEDRTGLLRTNLNGNAILSHIPVVRVVSGLFRIINHALFLADEGVYSSLGRIRIGNIARGALEVFSPASRTALLVGDVAMTALRGYAFLKAEK